MALPLEEKKLIEETVQEKINKLKEEAPGSMLMTKNVCNEMGLKGEERQVVSSYLHRQKKEGKLIQRGKAAKATQGNIYQIPEEEELLFDKAAPEAELPVVEPEAEPPSEKEPQLCHGCNTILDPLALGQSIISVLMKYDRSMDKVNAKFMEMSGDHHELVEENKYLKQMIDQKDAKILELNQKLSTGVRTMNMHDFQSKLGSLPSK